MFAIPAGTTFQPSATSQPDPGPAASTMERNPRLVGGDVGRDRQEHRDVLAQVRDGLGGAATTMSAFAQSRTAAGPPGVPLASRAGRLNRAVRRPRGSSVGLPGRSNTRPRASAGWKGGMTMRAGWKGTVLAKSDETVVV